MSTETSQPRGRPPPPPPPEWFRYRDRRTSPPDPAISPPPGRRSRGPPWRRRRRHSETAPPTRPPPPHRNPSRRNPRYLPPPPPHPPQSWTWVRQPHGQPVPPAMAEPWVDDLDRMPLSKRRRMLLSEKSYSPSSPPRDPPARPVVDMAVKRVSLDFLREWPGLPRGVKFDPSDEELLWHLHAKVGKGEAEPHPLISEFIGSLDEDDGLGYTDPQRLAGVKQDGNVSYFFHRRFKAFDSGNRKRRKMQNVDFGIVYWHKIGKTKPVIVNGIHQGCKKIMVLYMVMKKGEKPEKTNWVMHQYHLGSGEDGEGEFVASKIFYQQKTRQSNKNTEDLNLETAEAVFMEAEAAVGSISPTHKIHAENQQTDLITVEASTQAMVSHNMGEETHVHDEYGVFDKCDSYPKAEPQRGEIETPVLFDSPQYIQDIRTDEELCQIQTSCAAEAKRNISCISDKALIGIRTSEKDLRECQNDGPSRISVNLVGNIKENVTRQVLDEHHPADTQLPLEECYANAICEVAAAKYMSPVGSSDSTITSSSVAVDQSPPCAMSCHNSVVSEPIFALHNERSGTIHSCQILVPEVKYPVKEEDGGYMVASSESHSSAISDFIVHAGPMEECSVNGLPEMDTLLEYPADMVGSEENRGFDELSCKATCLSKDRNCPDKIHSDVCKTYEGNAEHFHDAHISGSKRSKLGQRDLHQNDDSKLSDSVQSTSPIVVKPEPLEESSTKCIRETPVELPQCDNTYLFDSVPSTFPVAVKAEPLLESHMNSSISGYPTENFSAATRCSMKDKLLSGGGNVQENVLHTCTFSDHASLPEHEHSNSSAAKLLSSTILDTGSSDFSGDSCMLSQFTESVGGSQDKLTLTGMNLEDNTDNMCFDQASFPNGALFDAPDKLQNGNCAVEAKSGNSKSEQPTSKDPPSSTLESYILRAGVKQEFLDEQSTDVLDQTPLQYRIDMPFSHGVSKLYRDDNVNCSQQTMRRNNLIAKTRNPSLRRKRKKTATDSVETALEEDAPGLLKVLLDKGITIEEIKLYGDTEDDDPLEISSADDNFEELETVISKLFPSRSSLLKFSTTRNMKGSKAVYCLACLISLIEQTRYLQFRNSPVEWGWCRDLQSFIFVFERHNRIVLERPEYGYATYFFELVDSMPVHWQTKRLVTTMKLSSCSRTTLIENRPLMVGDDLSEGEARVLEEYGWMPNTGIGTMLNYCDRVVHDKRNETYSLEWRTKIGKLLMNGHDAGRTIMVNPPKKLVKYMDEQSPAVKLEL